MSVPAWFSSIAWSAPVSLEALRSNRGQLPNLSGVYVFTNYPEALEPNTGVLYVGKATSLFRRVQSYLPDPSETKVASRTNPQRVSSTLKHAGKAQLLVEIQQKSRSMAASGIFVRWWVTASPKVTEDLLLSYLRPAYNTYGV